MVFKATSLVIATSILRSQAMKRWTRPLANAMHSSAHAKPPNIFLLSTASDQAGLTSARKLLESVLIENAYVLYTLSHEQALKPLWQQYCIMLVLLTDNNKPDPRLLARLETLEVPVLQIGRGSRLLPKLKGLVHIDEEIDRLNKQSLRSTLASLGIDTIPSDLSVSPSHGKRSSKSSLIGRDEDIASFLEALKSKLDANSSLTVSPELKLVFKDALNCEDVPGQLLVSSKRDPVSFDAALYLKHLKTRALGRLLLHAGCLDSSMDVTSRHRLMNGLAVAVDYQLRGRGRGGNLWLSPRGCAMFTLQLVVPTAARLAKYLPLVQHMIGVAVVLTCRKYVGEEAAPRIGLKWPNDVMYDKQVKLGGILVLTSSYGNESVVNIGVGLNLDNDAPTLGINRILRAAGQSPLAREVYLAEVFNAFEELLDNYEENSASFLAQYKQAWIHSQQVVKIQSENSPQEEATVIGIDEYGFLKVRILSTGALTSVQPDGNSFDLLQGLIYSKERA